MATEPQSQKYLLGAIFCCKDFIKLRYQSVIFDIIPYLIGSLSIVHTSIDSIKFLDFQNCTEKLFRSVYVISGTISYAELAVVSKKTQLKR